MLGAAVSALAMYGAQDCTLLPVCRYFFPGDWGAAFCLIGLSAFGLVAGTVIGAIALPLRWHTPNRE